MNEAAKYIMTEIPDLVIAYGVSDEYSFVFHESCKLFERRERQECSDNFLCISLLTSNSKLVTTIVSTFSSYYIYLWPKYFPDKPLSPPLPSFDGRAVLYPKKKHLRNYMSWRQADCEFQSSPCSKLPADTGRPHQQSLQYHVLVLDTTGWHDQPGSGKSFSCG